MESRDHIEDLVDRANIDVVGLQIFGLHVLDAKLETIRANVVLQRLQERPRLVPSENILNELHDKRNRGVVIHWGHHVSSLHPIDRTVLLTVQLRNATTA